MRSFHPFEPEEPEVVDAEVDQEIEAFFLAAPDGADSTEPVPGAVAGRDPDPSA